MDAIQQTMHNPYSCHTQADVQSMLNSMGLTHIEQLLSPMPATIRLKRDLNLPAPLDEGQSDRLIRQRASLNHSVLSRTSFLGGGLYEHTIPAVVDYLSERGEFLTSYTPYQPRMSQGSLEVLWEYQQMMQSLLGMPVVNASCYDGSTAMADAFNMVCYRAASQDGVFILAETIWPQTRQIVESGFAGKAVRFESTGYTRKGQLDLDELETHFAVNKPAAFGFQSPNCFGVAEDIPAVVRLCRQYDVVSVLYYHPFLSGIFVPPGELGVDIVCGEGQMLGNPLNAGGASLGFLGCQSAFAFAIPVGWSASGGLKKRASASLRSSTKSVSSTSRVIKRRATSAPIRRTTSCAPPSSSPWREIGGWLRSRGAMRRMPTPCVSG